jgi:hypothetical protein
MVKDGQTGTSTAPQIPGCRSPAPPQAPKLSQLEPHCDVPTKCQMMVKIMVEQAVHDPRRRAPGPRLQSPMIARMVK